MSYDLYFCTRERSCLGRDDLRQYFEQASPFYKVSQVKSGGLQAWYENPETGVYFSFDIGEPDATGPIPEGFCDTGLSFNINFARPAFFALEAMPLVESLAKHFGLLVFDPQDHAESREPSPKECRADDLVETWKRSNAWATRVGLERGIKLARLPGDRAMSLWQYQSHRQEIERSLGDLDVFVPNMMVLAQRSSGRAMTVVTWPEAIPVVIPPCDAVVIMRPKPVLFGLFKRREIGLMDYDQLISRVKPYLEPLPGPVPGLLMLRPERREPVHQMLRSLPLRRFSRKEHAAVHPGDYIEEELLAK